MARSFTLCLVVTLLMVFTVIEASREQTNQDGQKVQNRGTARYHHSRLTSQSSDFTALTTKLPRNKSSSAETASNFEKYETHFRRENSSRSRSRTSDDSVVTSRTNARYLNSSVDNSRNRSKLHTLQVVKEELTKSRHDNNKENIPESQTPKQQASRRTSSDASSIWIDSAKLDHEVFTKSPDYSRSRTGRKIYTSNGKGLRSQIILSRELANENMEKDKNPIGKLEKEKTQLTRPRIENITSTNISRVIDMKNATSSGHKEESIKERDVLPLNSENVLKIDIPLTVENGKDVNLLTSTTISSVNVSSRQASRLIKKVESNDIVGSNTKKSKQSDRSKSRDISNANNSEIMNSESIARRNSSRMAEDTGNKETNERSSRRRANIKNVNSRSRSAYKSKDTTETRGNGRNKNVDVNSETNANRQIKTRRNLSNNERMSEGKRRSKNDRKLKVTEAKIDKQNAQAQRNSSRPGNNLDIITTIPKATIAEVTTVSSLDTEIATLSSTTIRSSTVARIFSSSTEQISRSKERNRKEDSQVKKFPKEDFFNHGLGFRGRKISIIEGSSSTIADLKTTTSKSETQLRGNLGWTLKRRPNYVNHDISSTSASVNRNQSNEIILPNDLSKSTEAPLSNAKVPRRGTKRPKATKDESNIVSSVAPKNVTRGSKTFHKAEGLGLSKETESEESDNYPLAFRARLFQSQNSNLKFIGEKSTTGTSLQATKSSPAILFSERSKLKLDLARRLIKPDLNIDENNLNKTISVPSDKSQMKEISIVNKDKNVEKTTKATNKLDRSTIIANMQKEKLIVRDRWKILESRKSKDRIIEDSFRSTTYKKSQAPSERTIISSTVEGTSMNTITKFNNIPRRITHRNTISMEETTTAANIDMTKAQSSMLQSTTVPREEMSTNTVKALDENNIITTIKLLKLDKTSTEIIKSHKQERNKDDIQKETSVRLGTTSVTDAFIESLDIHTTEFPHEITLPPTIIRPSSIHLSTTESKKLYPVYIPDAKKHDSRNKDKFVNDASKNVFQPRYTKQQEPDKMTISTVTSMTVGPTSRYIRKKSGVFVPFSTEATFPQTKHREYRPRTATYRRHSEVSTSQLTLQQSTKTDKETTTDSVTITPTPTKYQVTARSRFNSSEPLVSVKINTSNSNKPLIFTESSNSNSSASNIFNPTKSAFFSQNNTLLEQLRSTVAPLLNTLNEKTPIFSGAYSNVNIESSAPRITPNGSPPRFSARYKGAELFVRKPSIDQVVIPSVTTSSTTASTLIKNSDLAPLVNSPGEPRFVTFYQALESASIRNENLGVNDVSQRQKLTGGDTTATTIAQGTVIGSRIIQPEQPTEITTSIFTTSSEFPAVDTTTILSSSIEPTTDTATTTSTSTITTTTLQMTSTKPSSRADLATIVGSMPETTIPAIDINENLISTETTSTTIASIESEGLTTTTITPMPKTTIISPTTQITTTDQIISRPPLTSFGVPNMGSYLGSFGGNQVTPASRVSSSSKAPIRDYQIYGIYPNKTIVRKRPEDNLIDARNINSPYVIFGIFPDGRLVRKFPNGTVIPDSPRNPVEVVFTLSTTTTTNRPASGAYYNQVNQMGTYNQYQSPVYYSRPVDKLMGGIQSPGSVDFGLTSNAIGVPSGVGPKFATSFGPPASAPCANKMSNILLNTPNVASVFGKLQDPISSSILPNRERSEASRTIITSNQRSSVYIGQDKFINYQIDGAPDINPKVVDVKINSVATSMNEGVASIPSFKNLLSNQSGGGKVTTSPGFPWKDPLDQIFGITTNSPMQTASVTSNQLNEPGENNVPIMARPINSLVEVFTPVMNSVTPTNPESKPTVSISSTTTTAPIITTIPVPITVATTTAPTTTTTTTTIAATTAPTTTTTTTTTAATTAPTTTTTTTTIATTAPTTTTTTTTTTAATTTTSTTTTSTTTLPTMTTSSISTAPRLATTASSINANTLASDVTIRSNTVPLSSTATISADNILNRLQMNTKENPFGATFEDLTFLNSLLQNNNVKTTAKTLNDIEQMLANRILELALAKPGPTRSPKAIKTVSSNNDLNAMKDFSSPESSSEPIIIDLLPSSSTLSPTVSSSTTTKKYTEAKTTRLVESSVPITTTKAPVVITAKSKTTTKRPRTTTQASVGFGVNLWRALFGSNRFETTTTTSTKKKPRPLTPKSVQTAQKSIEITQKPIEAVKSTTHTSHIMSAIRSHTTPRSVDISDIQVVSTKLHANNVDFASTSTPSSISTQRTLLNNPNPRLHDISTSTYSSEDDAKFLVALLRAIQTDSKTSTSTTPKIIEDDEAFLRAILNNQASISTATPSSTELNSAALLALLLKQQGIEPSTPAIKFREQLQLANLDLTTTQSTTTTTNKPAFSSSTQSVVSTRRKTTTPRQSSRSSLRTPGYTWSPSSTYPPPLFGENSGSGLITATRAIGQFLGSAITGAAQQLQSFLRNRRA
ncbi:uncharacterized protein [Anoplolepis gracilipes]|uniref:uncharacterized protein isoform X2 n=1 Tax=Anoplolepis gracilipes TaxID=354296 RepID=UPI003B9ED2FE